MFQVKFEIGLIRTSKVAIAVIAAHTIVSLARHIVQLPTAEELAKIKKSLDLVITLIYFNLLRVVKSIKSVC